MNTLKYFLSMLLIMTSFNSFAADNTLATIESADSLYQNGDCEKAIPAYQSIQSTNLNQSQKDQILFRTSYCHFSLSQYQESETGFKSYLSLHPNEEEAVLKYSQSLLYQDKYKEAEVVARKIKSADFKTDAAIVIARSQMETEDASVAVATLKPYLNNPEAIYWTGVANYNDDKDAEAEKNFKLAASKADKDSWVLSDSNGWVTRLQQEKRKFHARATVGVLKDTNIDQSGGSGTVNQGGPNGPGMAKASFGNTNYTSATGKYAALDLIHNSYTSRKLNLTTTASVSSPFYSKYPTYNQESASLDFYLKATPTSTFNYAFDLKYLDTFYHGKYSQDYIYFTPSTSWSFAPNYWLKFSVPVTTYLNSKKIKLYSGNVDLFYDPTNWMSVSMGTSYLKSSAPDAKLHDGGPSVGPVLDSGTMNAHYSTTGVYLGFTFYFADTYSFGTTGSYYKTKYTLDNIPGNVKHTPREDKLKSYQVSLTKTFIQNVLSATLSHSYNDNKSDGFPGLIYSGTITNNTYTRGYSMLSMEYYY